MVDKIVGPLRPVAPQPTEKPTKPESEVSFADLLKEKELKLSGHALERMESRNISPSPQIVSRLESAVERAKAKGSRECLVLMENVAYLVSIKNQTVVTVVGKEELRERIFTSIDSVVIG